MKLTQIFQPRLCLLIILSFPSIGCKKEEPQSQEDGREVHERNERPAPERSPKKEALEQRHREIERQITQQDAKFSDIYGDPDYPDISDYETLIQSERLGSSDLFELAKSCPDDEIRRGMLDKLFTFLGHDEDPEGMTFLDQLPHGDMKASFLMTYVAGIDSPILGAEVLMWISGLDFPQERKAALMGSGRLFGALSNETLTKLIETSDNEVRSHAERRLGARLSLLGDKGPSLDEVFQRYGGESRVTTAFLEKEIYADTESVAEMLTQGKIPEELAPMARDRIVSTYSRSSPMKAVTWINDLKDAEEQKRLSRRVFDDWLITDPTAAVAQISKIENPTIKTTGVEAIVNRLTLSGDAEGAREWADWLKQNK